LEIGGWKLDVGAARLMVCAILDFEKELELMLQQLVITTSDKTALKPLLESAIENQKKALKAGMSRTQARLAEFEKRYGLTSTEFERRLNARELEETFDFTDWRMEIGMLALLEKKYAALHEAHIVD